LEKLYCKTKLSTIALILVLAISITIVSLPIVAAQGQSKETVCFLGVMPNPIGVGQMVLMHVGITDQLWDVSMGYEGLTVTIERPDGETDTIRDIKTDATGGTGVAYTPSMTGTHIVQAHFPTQTILMMPFFFGSPYNLTYLASDSDVVELEVQQDPIQYYPDEPLPSQYWTRPIDSQLRSWTAISGSWGTVPYGLYAPYNDGPETAHILWAKPLTSGGLVGGEVGPYGWGSFEIGDAYEGKWQSSSSDYGWHSTSIIMNGKLYYQESGTEEPNVFHCVDLHTGEELWAKTFLDNRTIAFGQNFYWPGFNMHGAFPYLWVTTGGRGSPTNWYAFDAFTGDWVYTMEDIPSGTNLWGPNNEICRYIIDTSAGTVSLWNSTEVVLHGLTGSNKGSWGNNAHGNTFNASRGIMWTETIPTGLEGSVLRPFLNDRAIGGSISQTGVTLWGINLDPTSGAIGAELFNNYWEAPDYWSDMNLTVSGFQGGFCAWSQEDKVGVLWIKETREHYGFSLETGKKIWGPTPRQYYLDYAEDTIAESKAIAYGRLYHASVGGILYCYDIKTGALLWTYEATDYYSEFLFSNNWWIKPLFITDGKIYVAHLEHSPIDPRPRGGPFVCLNATTDNPNGEVIFRIDGAFRSTRWGGRAIIGDSIIATMDTYDLRVYAIGKGPSTTTVTASPKVATQGTSVLIEGTVMDVSPGTDDTDMKLRFPNGVPVVSDESMSDWMLYVYKQFEIPGDATGVEVVFNWVDSDGGWHDLGRTTTDMSGAFSFAWTPDTEGKYTIVATFMGSEGYYASYAETAIVVGAAPEAYPQPPSAEEIADTTVSKLPAYPDVPSASEVAQETVNQMPAYPEMPDVPEIPAYLTIDLVILVIAAIGVVIGLIAYMTLKKQK